MSTTAPLTHRTSTPPRSVCRKFPVPITVARIGKLCISKLLRTDHWIQIRYTYLHHNPLTYRSSNRPPPSGPSVRWIVRYCYSTQISLFRTRMFLRTYQLARTPPLMFVRYPRHLRLDPSPLRTPCPVITPEPVIHPSDEFPLRVQIIVPR